MSVFASRVESISKSIKRSTPEGLYLFNTQKIEAFTSNTASMEHAEQANASQPSSRFTITPVRTPQDLADAINLFTAYAQSLNLDLSFQDFQTEMASMPGKYLPSRGGELLLARSTTSSSPTTVPKEHISPTTTKIDSTQNNHHTPQAEPLGCVALRSLPSPDLDSDTTDRDRGMSTSTRICEMKRLYVTPNARGTGLGRALASHIIKVAKEMEYSEMRLDTLPSMAAAQGMYLDLGFVDIPPYCFNPVEGVRYLGLDLEANDGNGPG